MSWRMRKVGWQVGLLPTHIARGYSASLLYWSGFGLGVMRRWRLLFFLFFQRFSLADLVPLKGAADAFFKIDPRIVAQHLASLTDIRL